MFAEATQSELNLGVTIEDRVGFDYLRWGYSCRSFFKEQKIQILRVDCSGLGQEKLTKHNGGRRCHYILLVLVDLESFARQNVRRASQTPPRVLYHGKSIGNEHVPASQRSSEPPSNDHRVRVKERLDSDFDTLSSLRKLNSDECGRRLQTRN